MNKYKYHTIIVDDASNSPIKVGDTVKWHYNYGIKRKIKSSGKIMGKYVTHTELKVALTPINQKLRIIEDKLETYLTIKAFNEFEKKNTAILNQINKTLQILLKRNK
ncbi:MAG: hypothetical protein LBV37_00630 [Mycoplasmataceae bacterium]|nr:hypothetical protein [Mycoplasmataceae bacterium]